MSPEGILEGESPLRVGRVGRTTYANRVVRPGGEPPKYAEVPFEEV